VSEKVDLLYGGPDTTLVMRLVNPETSETVMLPFERGQVTKGVTKWAADQLLAMNPTGIPMGEDTALALYGAKFFEVVNGGEG